MNELIGLEIYYRDYLGFQCKGTIVYVEPNLSSPDTPWVYIRSEYEKENDKVLVLPNNTQLLYADLRMSSEVVPTSEEEEENFDDIF